MSRYDSTSRPTPSQELRINFTDEQIAAQAAPDVVERGRNYFRVGRVQVLGLRGDSLTARVRGSGGILYKVSFGLTPDHAHVKTASCECPAFYEHPGACKHIIAAMLALQADEDDRKGAITPVKSAPPPRRSDPASDKLLRAYMKGIEDEVAAESAEGTARLVPTLDVNVRGGLPSLSFKIGRGRPYVVTDLQELKRRFSERVTHAYGKNLTLTHTPASFAPDNLPMLNFFLSRFDPDTGLSTRSYGYYGYSGDKRAMRLTPSMLDELFALTEGQFLSVCGIGPGFDEGELPVVREDFPLRLRLEKATGGAELSGLDRANVLRGDKALYIVNTDAVRICSEEYSAACAELAGAVLGGGRLFFAEKDLGALFSAVLTRVEPYVKISRKGDFEAYAPMPLTAKIYLDAAGQGLVTARAEFSYGEGGKEPAFRDIRGELGIQNLLSAYLTHAQGLRWELRDDPDALYRLLSGGIPALSEKAEVYVSDAFGRVKIVSTAPAAVGVRVDAGLLDVDFDLDGIDLAELPAILASYRAARKYHRLRDGSFLTLEEGALSGFARLADGLDLSDKELEAGHARFAASRAMALDSLIHGEGEMRVERDAAFRQIIRDMREAENADYAVPAALRSVLRNYQKTGYRWLRTLAAHGFGGILADDMGLGKTIQLLALLESSRLEGGDKPSIVVCPASLTLNWASEAQKFAPELPVRVVMGSAGERAALIAGESGCGLIVTSYDLLKRDIALYEGIAFEYAVIDEAQYIKNQATHSARSVKALSARVRLALTGTPIENSLAELWSIFDFLMPGYLYNYNKFRKTYETPIAKNGDPNASERLKRLVRPFLLRRLKRDVLRELPEKTETILRAAMEEEQRKVYAAHLAQARSDLAQSAGLPAGQDRIAILAALTKLRQVCCDPNLLYEDYAGGSAKLTQCLELVEGCAASGRRMLLFSQFTSMLDIVQAKLGEMGLGYLRIDGATKPSARLALVNEFNAGDVPVFLISLKAGGTGLNLTGADVVIHYDPWWNVSAQNQATDRAHRIGQKRSVQVYKLIAEGTIEERILDMQARKADLADLVVQESEGDPVERLSREELLSLLDGDR